MRLAVVGVAATADHPGQRTLAPPGDVKVRRHQEARPALEDHLLDVVGVALDDAGDAGVERRLLGERSEAEADLLAHRLDVALGVGLGPEGGAGPVPLLLGGPDPLDEVLLHHAREAVERGQGDDWLLFLGGHTSHLAVQQTQAQCVPADQLQPLPPSQL